MKTLPPRILLTSALLAAAAAAPASAASVRHVEATGTATAGCTVDAPCGNVSDAVAAAAPGDTIRIGAGEFGFPGYISKPLKFEGAGTSKTLVKGMALAADSLVRHIRFRHNAVALSMEGDHKVRVEDVAVEGGDMGMLVSGGHLYADGLVVTGMQPSTDGILFHGIEGELHNVTMNGSLNRGLFVTSGFLQVDDAVIRARYGAELFSGATTIQRARIDASERGIVMGVGNNLEMLDSVVTAHGATAPAAALYAHADEAGPMTATVVRSTLAAVGSYARAVDLASSDHEGNVALVGSIAAAQGDGAVDIEASSATVMAKGSAYRTVAPTFSPVTAPGTEGNLAVAPGFANPAAGDWSLAQDSPLVDAGDPVEVPAGTKDAAGAPRMADGDGDGTARVDLGGLEHVFKAPSTTGGGDGGDGGAGTGGGGGGETGPAPDTTAPVVANLRVRRRAAKVSFTLSEAARVTVRVRRRGRVVRRVARDAPAGTATVRLRRRAIRRPGRYWVTVRAVDAAGNAALPMRAAFRVR